MKTKASQVNKNKRFNNSIKKGLKNSKKQKLVEKVNKKKGRKIIRLCIQLFELDDATLHPINNWMQSSNQAIIGCVF